jgi:hypothetical protein
VFVDRCRGGRRLGGLDGGAPVGLEGTVAGTRAGLRGDVDAVADRLDQAATEGVGVLWVKAPKSSSI